LLSAPYFATHTSFNFYIIPKLPAAPFCVPSEITIPGYYFWFPEKIIQSNLSGVLENRTWQGLQF